MSDNPDTIDTIVDDMLNEGHTGPADSLEWIQAKMKFYAERIKEAWKRQMSQSWHHREMTELVLRHEKELADARMSSGNAAKLREAVDGIRNTANSALTALYIGNDASSFLWDIIRQCKAALATPARNCDITHDEHELWVRWQNYCAEVFPNRVSFSTWLFAPATEKEGGAK